MADDFDLDSLAAYLHLDPAKVRRMADRGKIPGRRVGGAWRFARAEIHHWLEERILDSDENERARLETVLERDAGPSEAEETTLEALLPVEAVAVPLAARTKASVISSMVDLAAGTGWLWDPDRMNEAVRQREDLLPTAVEGGVALLHPRRPLGSILGRPFLAFGRTEGGIPFGDPSGGLTDLFFLILSVDDRGHLRALARLGRLLGSPGLLDALREAEGADEARGILVERERDLPT
ncbi:MAG: PTS sugar transporter subunit IIA [Planctomycetota bacterium]|jgi:PTS system nitrogen regulatory IIA component